MGDTTRKGLGLIELIIIIGLFGLFIVLGVIMLGNERAKTRDSQRLADITRVQAAFQLLYYTQASYSDAAQGCDEIGDAVVECGLDRYLQGIGTLKDPGGFGYTIAKVPDENGYAVEFRLERGYGTLTPGLHYLTEQGIR